MADTFTAHYNLTKPQIGGDPDTWGNLLNANFDAIDTQMFANNTLANAALPKAGGTLTGPLTINQTANQFALTIGSTGVNGAGFKLIGDGTTTPSKYIRARAGILEFVNDANSAIITTMSDAGSWNMSGGLTLGGVLAGVSGITLNTAGPYIYEGDTTNHVLGIRAGSSSGYSYFTFGNDGIFSALNGGGSFAGAVSASSFAASSFAPAAGAVELCARANNVYLRPNGPSNTSGQMSVNTAGLVSGVDFQASSDARLKTDIRKLRRGLDELKRMLPVEYVKGSREEIGFIAQEAQEVIPEAVSVDPEGFLTLSYGQVVALVASAVLDLDHRMALAGI